MSELDRLANPSFCVLVAEEVHKRTSPLSKPIVQESVSGRHWSLWHIAIEKGSCAMLELLMRAQLQRK